MATNIGRVEFIVDLDGSKVPAQARALGRQIAAAGQDSGKQFGKGFDSEFEKSLNAMSAAAASRLNAAGQLAGESFTKSFEKSIKRRAGGIQGALADTLADTEKLKKSLAGFEDLAEGVAHYERELEAVAKTQSKQEDSLGRVSLRTNLAQAELKKYVTVVRETAKVVEAERIEEEKRAKVLDDIAKAQEDLSDQIFRMNQLSRDSNALRQASVKAGRDYADVAADMRREMEGLNQEQQVTNRELTTFSDNLERTVESLRAADAATTASAKAKVEADRKRIESEQKAIKATEDRLAAVKLLDQASADIDRRMGNLDVYKRYVVSVGGATQANENLRVSFENLRNIGGSERSIVSLENRLDGFTRRLESSGSTFADWGKSLTNPLEKAAGAWRRMDGTVKLVIASILGAGDQVAVLGSALGAGLVALGGGITSLIVGAAAGVGVVVSLFQDIGNAPAKMKPTIAAFQDLGQAFDDVNDKASQAAFDEIGDSFVDLNKVVRALEPALEGVYRVIGKTIRGFADFAESAEGFGLLEETIKNAEGNLETFVGTVGTLGKALLRAFDGAQPLIEDMFAWMDRLANQFDDFTQSSEFSDWIRNAQAVWGSFSGTLDAVSLALHNLVTPEAVQRTTDLLDNLTRMAPGIGELLNTIGTLDPFGLLVDIFADLAEAFEAVAPAATVMAGALNAVIDAVPAPVWVATAGAITLFVGSFLAIKVAAGTASMFATITAAVGRMGTTFGTATTKAKGFAGVIGQLGGGKALAITGGLIAATVALDLFSQAIEEGVPKIGKLEDAARKGGSGMDLLRAASERSTTEQTFWGDYQESLKDLPKLLTDASSASKGFGGEALNLTVNQKGALDSLKRLGEGISSLAETDMPAAQKAFKSIVEEFHLTDKQAAVLLDRMGPLGDTFEEAAGGADGAASDTEKLNFALGRAEPALEGTLEAALGLAGGLEGGAAAAELQADALELLTGKSLGALDAVEGVADGIRTLGSAFRSQESANSAYEQSIDDVAASLSENGNAWSLNEQAGRDNQAAIMDLTQSTLDYASEIYNMTGSQEGAAAAIQSGRDAVIAAVAGMDLGGLSAEQYADKLGLIPGDVSTLVSANTTAGMEMADAFATRLYELGLIEVNPVLALDTAEADAAAAAVQGKLDALTFNPFTAILDANGDGVDDSVAVAKGMVYDFTTGEYIAKIGADNAPASAVVDDSVIKLDNLAAKQTIPKIDADNSKASAKTQESVNALNKVDAMTAVPDIDVDNSDAMSGIWSVQGGIDSLHDKTIYITTVETTRYIQESLSGSNLGASGGMFNRATNMIIGEAGEEALVPMNRSLALVDPAVRELSAFAQGITMANGRQPFGGRGGDDTPSSTSRVVNVSPGAIVIQGDRAPEATATNVVNRLAQRVAG